MNWDRRAFIKFALGAVAGLHVSPLVPKLMDDVSIWTQNWSWVPVSEKGEVRSKTSINPRTLTGVKVKVLNSRVSGKRIIGLSGDSSFSLGNGGLLASDASVPQKFYYENMKVTTPVIRKKGVRGQVSADEALEVVIDRLRDLKQSGKSSRVAFFADYNCQSIVNELLVRFVSMYGTGHLIFMPSAERMLELVGESMFGRKSLGFDLENSQYIISFGTPFLEGYGSPVNMRKIFVDWKNVGATFVQIEPRASITASQADIWLPCKPGKEGVLAYAMANLIVQEGKASSFVKKAKDFDSFRKFLSENYDLDKVSYEADVPVDEIKKVARGFMESSKAVAVCGPGNSSDPGTLFNFMAVLTLNAVKGNLGEPGGLVVREKFSWENSDRANLDLSFGNGTISAKEKKEIRNNFNMYAFAKEVLEDRIKIDTIVLVDCNPVYSGPRTKMMEKLLKKVPFVVSVSECMDETSKLADVVLPKASFLECWGDAVTPYASARSFYSVHKPLIRESLQVKSTGDWIIGLFDGICDLEKDSSLSFRSVEEALSLRISNMGDDFEKSLKREIWLQKNASYDEFDIKTGTGKVNLLLDVLYKKYSRMSDVENLIDRDSRVVMMGIPSLRTGSVNVPMSPYQLKILDETTLAFKDRLIVEVNPSTVYELGFENGEMVRIISAVGEIRASLHFSNGVRPGVIFVPIGLGHTAFGLYLKNKGVNFFDVVDVYTDCVTGLPEWELTPVNIVKMGEVNDHV